VSESIAKDGAEGKLSAYMYAGAIYYVSVGTLYLWGYWSSFGVNILEYLNVSDIIKMTAYPVVTSLVLFLIGALLGEITSHPTKVPTEESSSSKFGEWLREHPRTLAISYVALIIGLVLLGPDTKWYVVASLIAVPVTIFAKIRGFFAQQIQNERVRTLVVFVMAAAPIFSFGVGKNAADNIFSGKEFSYVISGVGDLQANSPIPPENRLRLLGHAGDYMFFMLPSTRALLLVKVSSGKEIMLGRLVARSTFSTKPRAP
jgi:hypothetical protein